MQQLYSDLAYHRSGQRCQERSLARNKAQGHRLPQTDAALGFELKLFAYTIHLPSARGSTFVCAHTNHNEVKRGEGVLYRRLTLSCWLRAFWSTQISTKERQCECTKERQCEANRALQWSPQVGELRRAVQCSA